MSIKNFKISTGLDLEGLILTAGQGELLVNGNSIAVDLSGYATEQYVIDSLVGVDFDLSNNAGAYLDWNTGTSEFDLNVSDLVTELTGNQHLATESYADTAASTAISNALITPTGDIIAAITSQGYITSAELPAEYTDSDAVNAINTALISGGGIEYVANSGFQVDTDIIATKAYADSIAAGLDVKASVKVATTYSLQEGGGGLPGTGGSNPWLATPGVSDPTIDGVLLSVGDRVLVKNDYDGSNGIYEVTSPVAGYYMLERTADGIINDTLTKGAFVFVEDGTNAGKGFVASIFSGMPIGSPDSSYWSQFSEAGNYISSVDGNFNVSGGGLSINKGYGLSNDENGYLYSTLVDQQILRDQDKIVRVWKQAYYGTYVPATNTASVSFSGATQWGEVTLRYGQRISKIMFSFDEWSEYGIVDYGNNNPSAVVDFTFSGGQYTITVSNAEFSGNLLAVVEFLGN